MVWSMLLLLLHTPSLSRKQGSLTTDSSESCRMMLFSLSVFRFWYISWLRSCRKWLTLGLVGLPSGPPAVPRPWPESAPPLARSRQQLQQSRPIGERQSSSDILPPGGSRWAAERQVQAAGSKFLLLRGQSHSRAAPVPHSSAPFPLLRSAFCLRPLLPTAAATVAGDGTPYTHTQTNTHTCTFAAVPIQQECD